MARHADIETLYDQPYDDPKRVRVSGPCTVESLSPHRVLSTDASAFAEAPNPPGAANGEAVASSDASDFVHTILDQLRKSGVQNTVKSQRLVFDRLDPFPGTWIHATGEYTERPDGEDGPDGANGAAVVRRVAVCIGPEHGTVGRDRVKEADKEAVRGVGFDLLIVCGFAFESQVQEESRRYGNLTVLPARMSNDLMTGMGELLKNTGAGNLFMVFGEPDITLDRTPDNQIVATIHGLDVYDPTTGQIRGSSTADIACWFIDTAYDGESFIVRHAYFTGSDDPYKRLRTALRAEIDEAAWASLYATTSRPFPPSPTGNIAIKVINHYGDEVLKVYPIAER